MPPKKDLKANFNSSDLGKLLKAHLIGNVQRDCFSPEQPRDFPLKESKVKDEETARGLYCRPAEEVDRGRQVKKVNVKGYQGCQVESESNTMLLQNVT